MKAIEVVIIGNENEENIVALILLKDRQARETRRSSYTRDRNGNHGHNPFKMGIRSDNRSRRRVMKAALADRCTHQETGYIFTKR